MQSNINGQLKTSRCEAIEAREANQETSQSQLVEDVSEVGKVSRKTLCSHKKQRQTIQDVSRANVFVRAAEDDITKRL
jgi:hypothetical protein